MKLKYFFFLLLIIPAGAQVDYMDQLLEESVYSRAPESVKHSKAFIREWIFFEERAYPDGYIPADAYKRSMDQKMAMKNDNPAANVTWTSIGPSPGSYPNYGNISSRIVTGAYNPADPNIIYIGPANGGVWKTTNGGTNWLPLTDKEVSLSMGAIAVDPVNPDIIYAGTGEATYSGASYYGRGLLKSTDAGATWTNITSGLPASSYFSRLLIRPGTPSHLLAAMGNSGLYRSTNSGLTWTSIFSNSRCDDILFTPGGDTAFAVGSGVGLKRSTNGGATFDIFAAVPLPSATRTHFDLCASSTSTMYAAAYTSASDSVKVYKSTNKGVNWAQVSASYNFNGGQAWYDLYVRVNPVNANQVFVGTIDIYRSNDGGTSFTNITNGYSGGNVHVDQHFLFFYPTNANTIIALNDGGIYRSTNSGTSFINLNQNLTLTQFYRITASPFTPTRILGGTQDNGTQQTYSAINWAAAFGGDGGEVTFNPFDLNYIIGETQNGGLRRTTNGGTSWVSATSGIATSENVTWVAPIIAHPTTSGTFYTARQKVYRSTNNGGSWTAISANVNGTTAVREMCISKTSPNIICATSGSQIFRSTDGGATFTNITTGLPARTASTIAIHPDSSNVMFVTYLGFLVSKVYKSTNSGASWFSIAGNLPDTPISDILIYTEDAARPLTYFVATDIGVFVTRNGGQTWTDLDDQLPNTVIKHLDYSPSTHKLRAGTHGRGVYEAYIDYYLAYMELELKVYIQGFTNGTTMIPDTVTVELRNAFYPYTLVEQSKVLINTLGQGTAIFPNAVNGTPYFIKIKHRNSIDTWSSTSVQFVNGLINYDFTTAANKAFGNNLKLVGTKYCIYNGDVNQDGIIDLRDMASVDNDIYNAVTGYVPTDITGDGIVNVNDMTVVNTNSGNYVNVKSP